MNKDTGGPAFPRAGDFNPQIGMTLRDYFAAKAIQGIVSRENSHVDYAEVYAKNAYKMADEMLKAREQ